ncbi:MAG: Bax inhibitor-1/YccA family protein [Planctomycetota bacterium]|nr:MAG: Bax inhibitor-1/YccA family protein [Planctomycetota bacterium]
MLRTANPAQRTDIFGPAQKWEDLEARGVAVPPRDAARAEPGKMSVAGTANKTLILLGLCAATAVFTWDLVAPGADGSATIGYGLPLFGGAIAGFIVALVTIAKPRIAPATAPVYALLEGAVLGSVSALYAHEFGTTENGVLTPNYAMIAQAVLLTFGVLGAMLIAYATRLIKPSRKFAAGVVAATGGIALVYVATLVLGLFGVGIPYIHDAGPIGIGFSLFVIVIAALNLVLDFDYVETGVRAGAEKRYEWYAAFSLMITLVWLYLEILRLLSKLQSRD